MNKFFLIAIIVFGGLIIASTLFFGESEKDKAEIKTINNKSEIKTLSDIVPADIPIYPGSKLNNSNESTGDDETYFLTVSLTAKATKSEINTWYRKALNENGWSITSDKNVAGYQIIQAENKNMYTSFQTAGGNNPEETIINQQIKIKK